ncbi:MAG TPA: glycosyl hydrolase family 28 protein [Ohtaekwangia sp.]|uniref:glycoside hydrolase family 28 protein n=1 Tax=Ohtaekwangia sp. TaxID=2066019 RepID=UPI002F9422E5
MTMEKNLLTGILLLLLSFTGIAQKRFFITDFGARGDGKTLNTLAIQKTIDRAASKGGGVVVIPAGNFLSGTLILKSGTTLWLDEKAVLLGSTDPQHYRSLGPLYGLIMADGQQNISITGKGTLDGQGLALALAIDSLHHAGIRIDSSYNYRRMRPGTRPKIIDFRACKQVTIQQVTIRNSASWVQNYDQCEYLSIDSIKVNSVAYWNNDGIDISDCKHVSITHCFVNAADDGICLKSEQPDKLNEDVYIAHCTVRSSANAVKFGTSSRGGFRNIRIEHITVYDTYRSAIALEAVDGGILEDVQVSDIDAANTGNAIFLRLGHRNKDSRVSILRNVTIRNVKAQIPFGRPDEAYDLRGPDLPFFHNPFPASITGLPGNPVENILLEDIVISYPGRATKGMAYIPVSRLAQVPEREDEYPEFSMFGELPAWAFYTRHADGIRMKNITVQLDASDYRPAFVFDDAAHVQLQALNIYPAPAIPALILQHCTDYSTDAAIQNIISLVDPVKK